MATRLVKVLLVEDDEDDFILTRDYLDDISYFEFELERVDNAPDAIAKLAEGKYDLCLLDFQLGAINGLEVLNAAVETEFSGPIIMLTGQADEEVDRAALDAGAADYLIKTELDGGRLLRAIRYAFARKEMEVERVERMKAEAENRAKSRFLAHLSHELRTPLTAIIGYTELLMNSEVGMDAENELNVIFRNGRYLLNLLNDVLDLSKIAADKFELRPTEVNLGSLMADIYSLLNVSAIDKGLSLRMQSVEPVPLSIFVDPTRIRQILINVISNAVKFTDKGHVDITVRPELKDARELLVFEVTDTGLGIPQERIDEIFRPFSQIAEVMSKNVGGSGLGLSISAELAQRMGGGISVDSTLGQGSRFVIRIDPGDVADAEHDLLTFNRISSYTKPVRRVDLAGRVLVVDDLRDIRRLIGHVVTSTGAKVDYADNGITAIRQVNDALQENWQYDLIVMDIHMPEMDGRTAIKELRNMNVSWPIIALTAASMKGSKEALLSLGFDRVLSKPLETPDLIAVLEQFLPRAKTITEATATPVNILLVEDDIDAAQALSLLSQSLGANVYVAHTIAEAEVIADDHRLDGALIDLNLPDGRGSDFAKKLRHQHPNIYQALASGDPMGESELRECGLNTLLLKPIQLDSLKQFIARVSQHVTIK